MVSCEGRPRASLKNSLLKPRWRRWRVLFLILPAIITFISTLVTVPARAADLTIGNYTLAGSARVNRYEYDYTYAATITNTGVALKSVSAALSSTSPFIKVIEGTLSFGVVAQGGTTTSGDTFIVRHDRRGPFEETKLVWSFDAVPVQPLVAKFRAVPETGNAPLKVTFFPEPITDTAIQRFYWDLDGNGTFELSDPIGNSQSRTYTVPGTYQPRLRVVDTRGAEDIQTITVIITNAPPQVTANAAPSNGAVPLQVFFTGSATDNEGIASYEWDFDGNGVFDFTSPTSATTSFTYTAVGKYIPVLRVTDRLGAATQYAVPTTEVRAAPVGSPTVTANAAPASGTTPLLVSFSGTASHPGGVAITNWEWDFNGDGIYDRQSATSATTTFTYTTAGVFYPRLRITAADNSTGEDVTQVVVSPKVSLSRNTDTIDVGIGQSVSITTTLGGETRVSVVLEDRAGQVVKTLVPWTTRAAGSYTDTWSGDHQAGGTVAEGSYYAILLYEVGGVVTRLDLSLTTGGQQYNPPRTPIPATFSPFAGQPLVIDFTLARASEVTAFIGRFYTDTRMVTFFQREPLGKGTHRITWNGENGDGQLTHPPAGDYFLFGIFGYYLPDNAVYVRSGAHVSSVAASPSIFNPSEHTDDVGTPQRSAVTFALSKTANVELTVADAQTGKTVARRLITGLPAGNNTVYWDGKDDNGVYVAPGRYRLGVAAIDANGYRSLRVYVLQRVYY